MDSSGWALAPRQRCVWVSCACATRITPSGLLNRGGPQSLVRRACITGPHAALELLRPSYPSPDALPRHLPADAVQHLPGPVHAVRALVLAPAPQRVRGLHVGGAGLMLLNLGIFLWVASRYRYKQIPHGLGRQQSAPPPEQEQPPRPPHPQWARPQPVFGTSPLPRVSLSLLDPIPSFAGCFPSLVSDHGGPCMIGTGVHHCQEHVSSAQSHGGTCMLQQAGRCPTIRKKPGFRHAAHFVTPLSSCFLRSYPNARGHLPLRLRLLVGCRRRRSRSGVPRTGRRRMWACMAGLSHTAPTLWGCLHTSDRPDASAAPALCGRWSSQDQGVRSGFLIS